MAEPSTLPAVREVERGEVDAVWLPATLPSLADLDIIDRIAARAAASAYIAGARTPERAAMLILAGREVRIGPWQALTGIHIIKDRPCLSANLMGALVQRFIREQRGGIFRVTEHTEQRCTIEYRRPEWQTSSAVTWTIEDARRAGLVGEGGNWTKFPRQMLFSRATGEAARAGFPDVVAGLYTIEEADDLPVPTVTVSAPAPAPLPANPPRPIPAGAAAESAPGHAAAANGNGNGQSAADVRKTALAALHAYVGDRAGGDPHRGLKLVQSHLYDDDGELTDSSLTDESVWTIERLRDFYRRLRAMHPADLAMVVTSEDGGAEPSSPIEVDGQIVDPDTGEILVPAPDDRAITDREAALIEVRDRAQACASDRDWTALAADVGDDGRAWTILAEAARTTGTVNLLRRLARQANANTPELEALFNARAKAVRAAIEAATP
jgi:hypothetical protein